MSKKDYILIAEIFANRFTKVDQWKNPSEKHATLTEIITIAEDFIQALKKDNPRFNREKFLQYINSKRGDQGELI